MSNHYRWCGGFDGGCSLSVSDCAGTNSGTKGATGTFRAFVPSRNAPNQGSLIKLSKTFSRLMSAGNIYSVIP